MAVGGYGARGTLGDIVLLDAANGSVAAVREGHRETVMSLAYCGPDTLASMDRSGRLLLWPDGGGKPRMLCRADAEVHGPAVAQAIAESLRLRPIAAGDRFVAAPVYSGPSPDGKRMTWHVRLYPVAAGQPAQTLKTTHYGAVTALACTADARRVASADQAGQLMVWDVGASAERKLPTPLPVISLAFSPRGDVLVAGTACSESTGASELQVWDVATGKLLRRRNLTEPVYACAVSPDGRNMAYVGGRGHDVFVEPLGAAESRLEIAGGWQVTAVGVTGGKGQCRIVYATVPEPLGTAKGRVFDPETLEIRPWAAPIPVAPATCGDYQAVVDRKNNRLSLYAGGAEAGVLQLDRERQGLVHSFCWVHDAQGAPVAVAVGTNIQCGVYVYGLPQAGTFPLLRYFRGHHDLVTSLAVSADGRLLVSGSRDGTVRCWPLNDLQAPSAIRRRWGAELAERSGQTVVAAIDELGPLCQQQVRAGDAIAKIMWLDGDAARSESQPGQIQERLAQLPWYAQVTFFTSRQGEARPPFNLVGGWHELLGLYTTDRDWIAWTPSGNYACSAGGERLIGWQVNSDDLLQTPAFFSADKFSKTLYRPDLIRTLLKTATADAAAPGAGRSPLDVGDIAPPAVKIVLAQQQRVDQATRIRVAAVAESKDGRPLVSMRLLLDGRPFGEGRAYAADDPSNRRRREDWLLELTPGPHQIAVQAESEKSYAADEIEVNTPGQTRQGEGKPTLRCLAVGVSAYPGRLPLRYGHSDAQALASILEHNAAAVFDKVEAKTLIDDHATKREIEAALQWLQKTATWRDVSVLFFAGHGLNDSSGKFFLLPVDGSTDKLDSTCIPDTLLKDFCQRTPGKVIVLLDACRAASVTLDVNDLALKLGRPDCGAIVITSSAGYQESLESPAWNGGAFTRALVDGLEGRRSVPDRLRVQSPRHRQLRRSRRPQPDRRTPNPHLCRAEDAAVQNHPGRPYTDRAVVDGDFRYSATLIRRYRPTATNHRQNRKARRCRFCAMAIKWAWIGALDRPRYRARANRPAAVS